MSRFPFYKEIAGQRALIVGGGAVALRRARALMEAGAEVVCVAPAFCEGFALLPAEKHLRRFAPSDIDGCTVVIAAADDPSVNAEAAVLARAQGCEVCASDDPEAGTFHFPAIIRRGGMTVAVSSGGVSPAAAGYIRDQIEAAIPENFESVLETMKTARKLAKALIPAQKERAVVLKKVFLECLSTEAQPDGQVLEDMIRRYRCTEFD